MSRFTCAKQDDRSGSNQGGESGSSGGPNVSDEDRRRKEEEAGRAQNKPGGAPRSDDRSSTGQPRSTPGGESPRTGQPSNTPGSDRAGTGPQGERPGVTRQDDEIDETSEDQLPGRKPQPGSERSESTGTGSKR